MMNFMKFYFIFSTYRRGKLIVVACNWLVTQSKKIWARIYLFFILLSLRLFFRTLFEKAKLENKLSNWFIGVYFMKHKLWPCSKARGHNSSSCENASRAPVSPRLCLLGSQYPLSLKRKSGISVTFRLNPLATWYATYLHQWGLLSWRMSSHALVMSAVCVQRIRSI